MTDLQNFRKAYELSFKNFTEEHHNEYTLMVVVTTSGYKISHKFSDTGKLLNTWVWS